MKGKDTENDSIGQFKRLNCCVIVPTYNNAGTIGHVVREILDYCEDVIVINDGSTDDTSDILKTFAGRIRILTHPFNWGKGVALYNGLSWAKEAGFTYAISIDSDGQHYPSDLTAFAKAIESFPETLLVGARNLQAEGMPGKNTFANRFSNFWFRVETGIRMEDTQSGFRAYPLDRIRLDSRCFTGGYEFELEILVFSAWEGMPIRNIPVRVYYPPAGERVSHFKPFRDFTKISILNTLLVLYCVFWQWPAGFFKKLTWKNIRLFADKYIIHSPDSNCRVASAIALGVFMGLLPIWGYQMIAAFALAHLLRLNKVIVLVASNVSLPPLIPFIIFGGYWTGCKLLGKPVLLTIGNISMSSIGNALLQYIVGSILLAFAIAVIAWGVSAIILSVFRDTGRKRS